MEEVKEQLIEYLEANDLKYIDREDKISHCCLNPAHIETNPSAFTMFKDGLPFSHCSSCGFHLNTEALYRFLELGIDEDMIFLNIIDKMLKEQSITEAANIPVYLPIKDDDFKKPYRGINIETFSKVGAYYTYPEGYYGKRIIFPIYDYENNLKSFEAVSTNNKIQPKILRPKVITDTFFGFEHLIASDTVWICEGLFSAISFIELGYDGLINFGLGSVEEKIRGLLIKGVKNVVLCGDNDEVGKKWNIKTYHLLKKRFNVIYFNYPFNYKDKGDANDLLKDGVLQDCITKTLEKNFLRIN